MSIKITRFTHDQSLFKVGDRVRIARKVLPEDCANWVNSWTEDMTAQIGKEGTIVRNADKGGFEVEQDDRRYCWPSCALMGPLQKAPMSKGAKKKRVRVAKDGPWSVAPCTHLRWHLMGFFREKLALVKSTVKMTVDGKVVEAVVAQVEVSCTKCGTKMTLQAK